MNYVYFIIIYAYPLSICNCAKSNQSKLQSNPAMQCSTLSISSQVNKLCFSYRIATVPRHICIIIPRGPIKSPEPSSKLALLGRLYVKQGHPQTPVLDSWVAMGKWLAHGSFPSAIAGELVCPGALKCLGKSTLAVLVASIQSTHPREA